MWGGGGGADRRVEFHLSSLPFIVVEGVGAGILFLLFTAFIATTPNFQKYRAYLWPIHFIVDLRPLCTEHVYYN